MIAQLPTLLALLGTVLLAVAIFAPARAAADPIVSFAPPIAAAPVERTLAMEPWSPLDFGSPHDPFATTPTATAVTQTPDDFTLEPAWPALVDPCAAGCDAAARLALVEALISVRAPWADAILGRAAAEERDPPVVAALAAAGYAVVPAAAESGAAYDAGMP